jgi:hypothetical protein
VSIGTQIARVNYIGRDVPREQAAQLFLERLRSKSITSDTGCFLYQGFTNYKGYGQVFFQGKKYILHRLVYSLVKGEIPTKHHVCHSCDVRNCWNPDHLWTGTNQENMIDCSRKGRADRQWMTHCYRGHEFNGENTRFVNVGLTTRRACKLCERIYRRVKAGWPADLAEKLPLVPAGYNHKQIAQAAT